VRRGDIYAAATGSGFGSKPRPVLVVQGNDYVPGAHVIVALVSSPIENPPSIRIPVAASAANGLNHDSLIEVDILVTVKHSQFGPRFGVLEGDIMERVDRALLTLLGFGAGR
jgi:mRNA interferase MazF